MSKDWIFKKITAYHMVADLPIKAYDEKQNLLFERGKIEAPFKFLAHLKENIFDSNSLFKNYNNENGEYFVVMNIDNSYGKFFVLIGPFMYQVVTYNELKHIAKKHKISSDDIKTLRKYFSALKILKTGALIHHYDYLAQLFECDGSSNVYLTDSETQNNVEKNKLEYREIDFYHHNYLIEKIFTHHFFKNRLTENEMSSINDLQPGLIAEDYVRNRKNLAIVAMGLSERYAIENGLDSHTSFTIGDAFLRKIENTQSISDIEIYARQALEKYTETLNNINKKKYTKKINDAKNFIDHNLSMDFTLQDIANHVRLNPTYLSRLFKKKVGVNISDYILKEKIEEAKILLRYSNNTLQEISDILNFSSKSYFVQCFKKVIGTTPGEYKNE